MNERNEEIASALPAQLDSLPRLDGFRLRGMQMTRLETFIDAAFAFAVTMIVIAAERVPDDINTLLTAFKHVPAFVASIVVLGIFWQGHWLWSRRYGLEDGVSIFISWALLVTILIYIYPLKAIFGSMFERGNVQPASALSASRTDSSRGEDGLRRGERSTLLRKPTAGRRSNAKCRM